MISVVISAIPQAGKRGVDTRDIFVTKQEAFQDTLHLTTVGQLNEFATQTNSTAESINDVAETVQPIFANIDDVVAVGTNIAKVNTVNDSIANVVAVGTNIAKVNTVNDSIANVNTVSDSIVNVNLVGNNIVNVSAVSNEISAVNTVADAIQGGTLPTIIDDTSVSVVATWSSSKIDTAKQNVLVSGTSIKTVNGTTLLGSGDLSTIQTTITGNAGTATTLQTARTINGVAFDGSANITVSDDTAVKLTGNQTINDIKTFTSSPIVPTPTTNTQAANKAYVDSVSGGTPTGTIITFASSTAPDGHLKANGALVSRTVYSALFAAIGTTFGVGDGSTTFALPDLRGYFPRGWDDGRGIDTSRVFGSNQGDAYLNHSHTASSGSSSHSHTGYSSGGSGAIVGIQRAYTAGNTVTSLEDSGEHTHRITVNVSTTGATETRPKNIALLYCIKY